MVKDLLKALKVMHVLDDFDRKLCDLEIALIATEYFQRKIHYRAVREDIKRGECSTRNDGERLSEARRQI